MKTHLPAPRAQVPSANRVAFTKVELLITITIASLLMLLQLAAAAGSKNQTKIAQCAGNLRQLGLTMLLYGNDNADKLPTETGGNWLWDLDWGFGLTLNQYGMPQDAMYCPGTAPRFQPTNNEDLYEYYAPGSIHVIGYAPTLPGAPSLVATNANLTIRPQPIRFGAITLPPPLSSLRVLNADATIGGPGTNFVSIPGGYGKAAHLSPHLNGYLPVGGNLGMLDGHVEWRSFEHMQLRTTSSFSYPPSFFW